MKFYCVIGALDDPKKTKKCFGLLKNACESRNIEFIPVEAQKTDLTSLPKLGPNDLLYRLTVDEASHNIAANMLTPKVATFYINNTTGSLYYTFDWSHTIGHQMHGLPIIPTITDVPTNRSLL